MTLNPRTLAKVEIPLATGWLLGSCMEARGKQDLWIRRKPELLEALRERAVIQSAESSNRIEGVTVDVNRLRPLLIGRARPRDRPEEELAGYRTALDWVFSRKSGVSLTPRIILHLQAMAQGGSTGDAGEWKKRDNEIVEILANGDRYIRFVPVAARKTPVAMEELCRAYQVGIGDESIPPLLLAATFILDFLCIHPFRDGNGRVSRLATSLLLHSQGFEVARYISLERLIEDSKEEYYRVLKLCSQGWHEGTNEFIPWWNYFLALLRNAYKEFESQVESLAPRPAKGELVRQTVMAQMEPFTLADIAAQIPSASSQLVKKVLAEMKTQGQIRLTGRGRGARWEVPNA